MPRKQDKRREAPTVGAFRRHAAYEIRAGLIRPARGSSLVTVEPWAKYEEARCRGKGAAPYESIFSLCRNVRRAGYVTGHPDEISAAIEDLVRLWVNDHGVLGVLLHRVSAVALAERWERSPTPILRAPGAPLFAIQHRMTRTAAGWVDSASRYGSVTRAARPGDLVAAPLRRPWALVRDLRGPHSEVESLGEARSAWRTFFPDVPEAERESFAYPLPLSDRFWEMYAEPVTTFLGAAMMLEEVAAALLEGEGLTREGTCLLDAALAPVGAAVRSASASGAPEIVRPFSSWMASIAMMIATDATAEKTSLRRCSNPKCNAIFVAERNDKSNVRCSGACRQAAHRAEHSAEINRERRDARAYSRELDEAAKHATKTTKGARHAR